MGSSLPIRKKNATKPKKQEMSESAVSSQSGVIHKNSFNPKSYIQAKQMVEASQETWEDLPSKKLSNKKSFKRSKNPKEYEQQKSSSQTKDYLYQEDLEELPSDLQVIYTLVILI